MIYGLKQGRRPFKALTKNENSVFWGENDLTKSLIRKV